MDKNYFAITDTGKVRDNNEDAFIAEKTADKDLIIACVIDGVGGYAGGEIASEIARYSIMEHLMSPRGKLTDLMKTAIIKADEEILAEKRKAKEYENMACVLTLVLADLPNNQFHYAHVGDTRLYLLRDHTLVKISKDQSFVGFMEDSGRLTEEQAMQHPKRNEINKALGFGNGLSAQEDYIELGQSPFLPGDLLLICSDGLSDMLPRQDITEILMGEGSLQEKGQRLIQEANNNGGRDNITVVLVKNDKETQQHDVARPSVKNKIVKETRVETIISPTPVSVPREDRIVPPIVPAASPEKKSGRGALLPILCLLLLASTLYLLWDKYTTKPQPVDNPELRSVKPPRYPQEKLLQDTLDNLQGNTLILSDSLFKSPILITEPLQINKDTVYIIAENNTVIKRDVSFREIPILIGAGSKHVSLENFTFEDFPTAISTQSNALVFKNVRFVNSPNAVQGSFSFPAGKYISGKIPRSKFTIDSLPLPSNN